MPVDLECPLPEEITLENEPETSQWVEDRTRQRRAIAFWTVVAALCIVRFFFLSADFPNHTVWAVDDAKYTDEGWWANGAVMHRILGHWNIPGDYNPAAAVPVWPLLMGLLFHFTGLSIVAARAVNVCFSIATLGIQYALVRRYTSDKPATPAMLAVLVMAASPFAFVFCRLAILDTLVLFELSLSLFIASFASARRIWPLAALSILVTLMVLSKTTAAVLVPAILWTTWSAMGRGKAALLRTLFALAALPAAAIRIYVYIVGKMGFGEEYSYFFNINALPGFEWRGVLASFLSTLGNGLWIGRVLYPAAVLALVLSIVWKRELWRNALFAACWIAVAAHGGFIVMHQDDAAARYFIVLLGPLAAIVAMAYGEVAGYSKKAAAAVLAVFAIAAAANVATIAGFLSHRQYQYRDAALAIRDIVRSDPAQKQLILGVSSNQISLMTGVPSINDFYGSIDLDQRAALYRPGWYLVWNSIAEENLTDLSAFRLVQAASYPVFDRPDRNRLILYKMLPRTDGDLALRR